MLYFDTSFLAPLLLTEQTTRNVERFVAALPAGGLAISQLVLVEITSALARETRMGNLTVGGAAKAEKRFEKLVEETFSVLTTAEADFVLARTYIRRHETGLRPGDALHLAIARNNQAQAIYTLDKGMLKAGALLGLPVGAGI